LDNSEKERRDTAARAEILLAHFGDGCVVRDLTADDVAVYAAGRKTGGIRVSDTWTTKPVRARSASADVAVLNSMLNWARQTRSGGMRLLDANPLSGVRCPRNTDPRRPLASWERFTATRQAMQELAGQADSDAERFQWVLVELALVLAEATGRRLGSIRNLQWQDVDWEHRTIRWRREHDKKRRESIVPMPEQLVAELRQFQRQLGAVGGWIFASDYDASVPLDRHVFAKWLLRAEKRAKLPKLDGSLWHAFRRKWATERKCLPLTDVAAAGGWQNTATLLTCYQQPTNDGLLAVMSEETKVRDVAVNAH
jgi:integrase